MKLSTCGKVLVLTAILPVGAVFAGINVVPLPTSAPEIEHGHLPPPGECRIWMPDQSPGQQPSGGPCAELSEEVPPGGWLIYRATPEAVGISAYSIDVEDLVGEIRYYDAKTLEPLAGPPEEVPDAGLEVPRGQLPAPGECQVWHPGRSAGGQPGPTDCAEVLGNTPLGAWVLYRSSPIELVVTAYHPEIKGIVLEARTFDIDE